jgi:hypothetical protein
MVNKMYPKKGVKANTIHPEFSGNRLTNYAGLVPFSEFLLKKLPFRQALAEQLDLQMAPNCTYQDWQVFGLIVFGYLCGYRRLAHFEELSNDVLIQNLLGLDGPIDENTLAYRLKKAGHLQSVQMGRVSQRLAAGAHKGYPDHPPQKMQWIDFDSTVKGVYGHQQGAAKGFNPARKGQKSYHPLLAFDAASKEVLHSWWRSGDAYTGNGAGEFFIETAQRLPETPGRQVVRADSGFFSDGFLSAIETAGRDYLVKVKLKNLKGLLGSQDWQPIPGEPATAYCTFTHRCAGWETSRSFVGIRLLTEVRREGLLFPKKIYAYFCYCSTLAEAPLELHRLYGDRGECENWIQAVKNQLGAGTTLTGQFWANALLWQLGVLAYNLSIWLRRCTDRASWREEPRTFRAWFIHCAGKLVCHARQWTLKMQSSYHYRPRWEMIYRRVCRLQL